MPLYIAQTEVVSRCCIERETTELEFSLPGPSFPYFRTRPSAASVPRETHFLSVPKQLAVKMRGKGRILPQTRLVGGVSSFRVNDVVEGTTSSSIIVIAISARQSRPSTDRITGFSNPKMGQLSPDEIQSAVDAAFAAARLVTGGKNADYIPFLASVPSDNLAVVVATASGSTYLAGNHDVEFAIESISKVFTMALAMNAMGPEEIRRRIGAEATGLPFNSVVALELHSGKPLSPLVNAGAIATTGLIPGDSASAMFEAIAAGHSAFAGRTLEMSEEVNASEQATNQHNKGIAYLLNSAGYLDGDPLKAVDAYTRQCSLLVTCKDLAVMGATLANRGINPLTQQRVITEACVPRVLAEMAIEGLYTASGDFAFEVGLPGKSGVGGGILAVAPGKLAIAAWSPPLDEAGNSVRGWKAVAEVANRLGLNLYAA